MKKKYLLTVLALVILRALDLTLTYLYTKDLQWEWNPLVSWLGSGWIELVIIQGLTILLIAVLMYFYFTYDRAAMQFPQGLSFQEYFSFFYFRTPKQDLKNLNWRNWNRKGVFVFQGFVLTWAAFAIQIFAITHNLLLIMQVQAYESFVAVYYKPYFLGVFFLVGVFAIYAFFMVSTRGI